MAGSFTGLVRSWATQAGRAADPSLPAPGCSGGSSQCLAHRVHEEATCPQMLPGVVAFAFEEVPRHVDARLPLMKPTALDTAGLGGTLRSMCTWSAKMRPSSTRHSFCSARCRNTGPSFPPHDAKERSSPVLGDKHNVVFALLFGVTQTAASFHGFLWVVRFGRLTSPPHGRPRESQTSRASPAEPGKLLSSISLPLQPLLPCKFFIIE